MRPFLLPLAMLLAAPLAAQDLTARQIVERSFEAEKATDELRQSYVYRRRNEERFLDKRDEVKKTEVETYEVLSLYGEEYERLVGRDDRPLSPKDAAKEQQKLDKEVAKRADESPKERAKRLEKEAEEEEDRRRMIAEVVRAYDFERLPDQTFRGADCYVIAAEPKPDYEPEFRKARFLSKLHGTLWISKGDFNWVKAETETIDNVSFGMFLFKLQEGAILEFEQSKVNGEVWMLDRFRAKFHGKIGMIKGLRREFESTYSDFRKFSAESKLLAGDPVDAPGDIEEPDAPTVSAQ